MKIRYLLVIAVLATAFLGLASSIKATTGVGPQDTAILNGTPVCVTWTTNLQRGSGGVGNYGYEGVIKLQDFLRSKGFQVSRTGYFWTVTRDVLTRYQNSVGITSNTGKLFPNTRNYIRQVTCAPVVCGSANKTYPANSASYGADTFCTSGNPTPATLSFPTVATPKTWTCGTPAINCTATLASSSALYTLTTAALHGTVTKNPNTATYAAGTPATLTETPNTGYVFNGWSGDATGSGTTTTVTMNANKTVTANFTVVGSTLTTITNASTSAGANTGSVGLVVTITGTNFTTAGNYIGLFCGASSVNFGQSGASSTNNNTTLAFTIPSTINSNFTNFPLSCYLEVYNANGMSNQKTFSVTVPTPPSAPITVTSPSAATFNVGDNVTIAWTDGSATATSSYYSLNLINSDNSVASTILARTPITGVVTTSFTAGRDVNTITGTQKRIKVCSINSGSCGLSAYFNITAPASTYTLTTPAVNGAIARNPSQTSYASGTVVTLTETPNTGYFFNGWSGDTSSSSGTLGITTNVTMSTNKSVTANFRASNQPTIISVYPLSATAGTVVTVTGTNFTPATAPSITCPPVFSSPYNLAPSIPHLYATSFNFTSPPSAMFPSSTIYPITCTISVTTAGGTATHAFAITSPTTPPAAPTVTSAGSGTGTAGSALTVTGTGFVSSATGNLGHFVCPSAPSVAVVNFNLAVSSSTTLTSTIPSVLGTVTSTSYPLACTIYISNSNGNSATIPFTITSPAAVAPTVTSASTSAGSGTGTANSALTVTGTGFVSSATGNLGHISCPHVASANFNLAVSSPTMLTGTIPSPWLSVVPATSYPLACTLYISNLNGNTTTIPFTITARVTSDLQNQALLASLSDAIANLMAQIKALMGQ